MILIATTISLVNIKIYFNKIYLLQNKKSSSVNMYYKNKIKIVVMCAKSKHH